MTTGDILNIFENGRAENVIEHYLVAWIWSHDYLTGKGTGVKDSAVASTSACELADPGSNPHATHLQMTTYLQRQTNYFFFNLGRGL